MPLSLTKRDLLSLFELSSNEIHDLIDLALDLKESYRAGEREPLLARRVLALLFEKPSLRTRVSFEAAITHLGGTSTYLGKDVGWGDRESIADFARTLSRYVDVIVFRGSDHATCLQLAEFSRCPVINGLTRISHPCQALADAVTIRERFGALEHLPVAYIGDCNNVANSLTTLCAHLRMRLSIAHPQGFGLAPAYLDQYRHHFPDAELHLGHDPQAALRGAKVVYTDVWVSMGDEAEREHRRRIFGPFQVNADLMSLADPDAIFLHCLPAHREEEVSSDVMDSPQSVVFDQAENRMHVHKAILLWVLNQLPG